jgi:DNA invertase Pin-like site-specific DNA recombinase
MARKSRKSIVTDTETAFTQSLRSVAAYIRLSVEDNKKRGDSIETQKGILESYLAANPELRLYDFYIDNGTSGTNFHRPEFQRMLSDAENGVINCIIVKDLSRLGRNVIDTGYYIEKYLPSLKVRFVAVTDDYDSNNLNSGDGIMLPLKNMINEAYALDIGRKIKAQLRQAMQAGEYLGTAPPYGYLKHPENCHRLVIDPETSPIVRKIFEWAYEKTALIEIVRRLNEAGIPTPSCVKKAIGHVTHENPLGKKNKWQTRTIGWILANGVYTGDMIQGKSKSIMHNQIPVDKSEWITVRDTHEAIVRREMFEAVQVIRKQIATEFAQRKVIPYTPNIFKGKIFCGHCGGVLQRQRSWKRKTDGFQPYVFRCFANSNIARGSCLQYSIQEHELIDTLLTVIKKHADAVIGMSLKLRKNSAFVEAGKTKVKSELSALRLEMDKDSRLLKSLYESLVSGVIGSDEYREMRLGYEEKIAERLSRVNKLENSQKELENRMSEYLELTDLISKVKNSEDITAELIDMLVERIRVFHDGRIEADFRFSSGFEQLRGEETVI